MTDQLNIIPSTFFYETQINDDHKNELIIKNCLMTHNSDPIISDQSPLDVTKKNTNCDDISVRNDISYDVTFETTIDKTYNDVSINTIDSTMDKTSNDASINTIDNKTDTVNVSDDAFGESRTVISKNNRTNKPRYFKCLHVKSNGEVDCTGRYTGQTPMQAASKAFTKLCLCAENEGKHLENITFGILEATRSLPSDEQKIYIYSGIKKKLVQPDVVHLYIRDPETKEPLLDNDGFKIPKLDATGNPIIIKHTHINHVTKITDIENLDYQKLISYCHNI